jgi:hypothetical protein
MKLFQVWHPLHCWHIFYPPVLIQTLLSFLQHTKVVAGTLKRRYKRFLADVRIGDCAQNCDEGASQPEVVFVPNTGSMAGLLDR